MDNQPPNLFLLSEILFYGKAYRWPESSMYTRRKNFQSGWGFVRNSFSVGCRASFALHADKLCGKLKKLNRKGFIKRGRKTGGKIMQEKCMT